MSKYYVDTEKLLKRLQIFYDEHYDSYTCRRCNIPYGYISFGIVKDIIRDMAVDADDVGRKCGEWVLNKYKKKDAWGITNCFSHTCSVCGANRKTRKRDYCPECGSDMGNSNIEILIESMTVGGEYDKESR